MKSIFFFFALLLIQSSMCIANADNSECVILLHGMDRTAYSMQSIESSLKDHGYQTVSHGYPSTSKTIEQIANNIIPQFISECSKETKKIHFVTHSLGGIITRYYLQSNILPAGSRVVMLSPPNKGSEIADHFNNSMWYKWLTGPPGQQLTTDQNSIPNQLKAIPYDVGIITGRQTFEPWFSRLIPGEDDGKVSVNSARLKEMKDFLIVDHTHTFIMNSNEVKQQIVYFLKNGVFEHAPQ